MTGLIILADRTHTGHILGNVQDTYRTHTGHILGHVQRSSFRQKMSKIDQVNLDEKIKRWKRGSWRIRRIGNI